MMVLQTIGMLMCGIGTLTIAAMAIAAYAYAKRSAKKRDKPKKSFDPDEALEEWINED